MFCLIFALHGGGGAMHPSGVTIEQIMQPFVMLLDFARNYKFYLGQYQVTFMQIWIYCVIASLLIYFIWKFIDNLSSF